MQSEFADKCARLSRTACAEQKSRRRQRLRERGRERVKKGRDKGEWATGKGNQESVIGMGRCSQQQQQQLLQSGATIKPEHICVSNGRQREREMQILSMCCEKDKAAAWRRVRRKHITNWKILPAGGENQGAVSDRLTKRGKTKKSGMRKETAWII